MIAVLGSVVPTFKQKTYQLLDEICLIAFGLKDCQGLRGINQLEKSFALSRLGTKYVNRKSVYIDLSLM